MVLIVDDSPSIRQLVVTHLELADYEVLEAEDGAAALALLQEHMPAVILLDWMMPGMEGPEVAQRIRTELGNQVSYLIMLTARSTPKDQVQGLRTGIDLYVTKPFEPEVLMALVEKGVEEFHRRNQAARDRQWAHVDALTGLANRRAFDDRIASEFARARRLAHPLSLVMIDLDHFKAVNDQHGHPAGDQVLRELAGVLREAGRASDLLFRYGGEEFALLLPATPLDGAHGHAEQLRQAVARHVFSIVGNKTASLGVATLAPEDTPALLLARADVALYQAKQQGRNRVVSTPP